MLYNNQPFKYAKFDNNIIINIIKNFKEKEELRKKELKLEKLKKEKLKKENQLKQKKLLEEKQLKQKKLEQEKQLQQMEVEIINNLQYLTWKKTIKSYGVEYTSIDKNKNKFILNFYGYGKQDTHKNKLLYNYKTFKYTKCDIISIVNMIEESIKKNEQILYEKAVTAIARNYNTTIKNVNSIAGEYKSKCSYYSDGKCSFYKITSSNCFLEYSDCVFHDEFIKRMIKHSEKNLRKQQNNNSISKSNKNKPMLIEIGLKDFVVRTNVFKCMHNKHKIDNIVAMINIDNDGKREQIKISAGYCNECKVYFMLNSTYQALKNKGLILCRITDEKSYLKGNYANGIRLAKESILMQYGYNTSQTNGLSATGRQKILAVIIDNKIMSKSEIISYLDFFINQRSSQARMELAISKWETDREFVENYKIGQYTQFGVNAIYRR